MNNLILRTTNSPYGDINKGSVLSQSELDNNFVTLKGEVIYTAITSGSTIVFNKINGSNIVVTAATVDTYVTGATLSTGYTLTLTRNDNVDVSVNLASLASDVYVLSGSYNSNTGVVTFTNSTGGTFTVNGFLTGFTEYWTSGSTGSYSIKTNNNSGLDAINDYAVAEGYKTTASGHSSHAEGQQTTAGGAQSHAEGSGTTASGNQSHAEGNNTTASGSFSHAGGFTTTASGFSSFVHGSGSTASGRNTIVFGEDIIGAANNTVYVPYLNINTTPQTGDTTNNILVRANDGSVKTISQSSIVFTGNTSGSCISDIFVSNIHSCSPLHIQPTNTGDVYISENGGNVGIGTSSPTAKLDVRGDAFVNGDVNITGNVNIVGTATTINTQILQARDNNIFLNYSGTHLTAIGGGITVLSGVSNSGDTTFNTDVNGNWVSNTNIYAPVLSATTIYGNGGNISGLPYVTGGTYSNGNTTFTNSTGGTFTVSGFYTGTTDVYVTGGTPDNTNHLYTFTNNTGGTFNIVGLTDTSITGVTFINNILTLTNTTGGTFTTLINSLSGLTVNGNLTITGGTILNTLTATTISATTYVNLPTDVTVTGGTVNSTGGTATFTNNTGGTFTVTGFSKTSKYLQTTGLTANVTSTIIHGLSTSDIIVQVKDLITNELVNVNIDNYTANTVDITSTVTMTSVRIMIIGL